jgi:hypothetical protein
MISGCLCHGRVFALRTIRLAIPLALGVALLQACPSHGAEAQAARWWRGNLHTHTFWSDGDDFPENVVDWYKRNGYQFLALSDHNVFQEGTKWLPITNAVRRLALANYRARFGEKWVDFRPLHSTQMVRLKTFKEFRKLFNEPDRFLLLPGEEISDKYRTRPLHLNLSNLRHLIHPQGGSNVTDVLQRTVDAALEQRRRTGRPMVVHVNHPNFGWAITAEDLLPLRGERFFEVYNGHPAIHNDGDEHHASVERVWDILLAFRLSQLKAGPLYALAVDDSHRYHETARTNSNPGRGWIVVRATHLQPADLITAMEDGDFYASTGVRLKDVRRTPTELAVEIDAEPGVSYRTQFIGTLRGFDPTSQPGPRAKDSLFLVTREYSSDIGALLGVVEGPSASYRLHGDELYVRAKIISSKKKLNGFGLDEMEVAWTQPLCAGD